MPEPCTEPQGCPDPSAHEEAAQAPPTASESRRAERSLTLGGRRAITLMWERTQRSVALALVAVYLLICVLVAASAMLRQEKVELPPSLAALVGFVVGAYFNRTTHDKNGVTGTKPL